MHGWPTTSRWWFEYCLAKARKLIRHIRKYGTPKTELGQFKDDTDIMQLAIKYLGDYKDGQT